MDQKRSIDRQRDAAITLNVDDEEDSSPAKFFMSTSNTLYVIKQKGVFKIQIADDIDPKRTNPNIQNLSQKILSAGDDNEIVARILLTAKCLFDENNAVVSPFVGAFFEQSIDLTKHILELHQMVSALKDKILSKEKVFQRREHKPNSFFLPSIPDLDTNVHNICVKADKAKDSILSLYRLHFFPDSQKKISLDEYDTVIKARLASEPGIAAGWLKTKGVVNLIRNSRNASEHRNDGQQLKVKDFEMNPDGSVNAPVLEIQHRDTPIGPVPVVDFIEFIGNVILEQAEWSIAMIRCAVLLDSNPFNEQVGFLEPESRRHPHIRYCRALNFEGTMRILE